VHKHGQRSHSDAVAVAGAPLDQTTATTATGGKGTSPRVPSARPYSYGVK
jgi:hypothetical protein